MLAQTLIDKFTIFYGNGSYESKQEADHVIQEIIRSPLFPECFLFFILFVYDSRRILQQHVAPTVLFGVFICVKNLVGTPDGQYFLDLYSIRRSG